MEYILAYIASTFLWKYAFEIIIATLILWVWFVISMYFRDNIEKGTFWYYPALLFVGAGYIYDGYFNFTVGTILFAEFPREFTLTERLKRHVKGEGKRKYLAVFICKYLIEPWDFGHCST